MTSAGSEGQAFLGKKRKVRGGGGGGGGSFLGSGNLVMGT